MTGTVGTGLQQAGRRGALFRGLQAKQAGLAGGEGKREDELALWGRSKETGCDGMGCEVGASSRQRMRFLTTQTGAGAAKKQRWQSTTVAPRAHHQLAASGSGEPIRISACSTGPRRYGHKPVRPLPVSESDRTD